MRVVTQAIEADFIDFHQSPFNYPLFSQKPQRYAMAAIFGVWLLHRHPQYLFFAAIRCLYNIYPFWQMPKRNAVVAGIVILPADQFAV